MPDTCTTQRGLTQALGLRGKVVDERKFLSALLSRLDRPDPRFLATRWPLALLWVAFVAFFMLIMQIAQGYTVNPVALALGSLLLGLIAAWVGYSVCWARQWPLVRGHLDRQSLRARLDELEP